MAKEEATLLLKIKQAGAETIDNVKTSLTSLAGTAKWAFAAIVAGGTWALAQFKEQEDATKALNQAMVNAGMYTKQLSGSYLEMASALQKVTTYGDEQIIGAQATMTAYMGQIPVTKELMMATLNLATVKKMDLASAAEMVAKTIGTSTNALRRQGLELDDNATKSEKMAATVQFLNSKFGGQAEAAGKGLGVFGRLKNSLGEIGETIGSQLAPSITAAAETLLSWVNSANEVLAKNDAIGFSMEKLEQGAYFIQYGWNAMSAVVMNVIGGMGSAIQNFVSGNFTQAWNDMKTIPAATTDAIATDYQNLQDKLTAMDQRRTEQALAEGEKQTQDHLTSIQNKRAAEEEDQAMADEAWATKSEEDIAKLQVQNDTEMQMKVQKLNDEIAAEQNFTMQMQMERQKRMMLENAYWQARYNNANAYQKFQMIMGTQEMQAAQTMLNSMSQMQNSRHKEMVAIGKAAAIAQIGINTAQGATAAIAAMSAIPIVGPALGFAAAAAIIAYGAEQIGNVAGVQLAEGGIVKATPGGVNATIGEGGRDEAVIPLDEAGGQIGGNNIAITVNGGMLGDANTARELAVAIDRELLSLRRSGQAVSYEEANL